MNEKHLKKEEENWAKEKELIKRKNTIKEEKNKLKSLPTSKLLIIFLFLNCSIIEIFTILTTIESFRLAYKTGMAVDFSPLNTLIGTVIGEVIGYAVYSLKSAKENSAGGITYEMAMKEIEEKEEEEYGD